MLKLFLPSETPFPAASQEQQSRGEASVEGGGSSGFRRLSPSCRNLSLHLDYVSSPCSPNRACGFPGLDSHLRSQLRSLKAMLPHPQSSQTVVLPQPAAHELPRLHPFRPAQQLVEPLAAMRVDGGVGRVHLPQTEGHRPSEQHSVRPFHHLRRGSSPYGASVSGLLLPQTMP